MLPNILLWLLFGAAAGWAASKLMGSANSLITNIILGIIGSLVGGFLAGLVGIDTKAGFSFGSLIIAIAGACIVIWFARIIRR